MTENEQFKINEWNNIINSPEVKYDGKGNIYCIHEGNSIYFDIFDESRCISLSKEQILGFICQELIFDANDELISNPNLSNQ